MSVKIMKVSPVIKGLRWSLLGLGILYGKIKFKILSVYEFRSARPKRELQLKEKYERLAREQRATTIRELQQVAVDFEVVEFPPGWSDGV